MNDICPYLCSFKSNSGYCGRTGGSDDCQYRKILEAKMKDDYISRQAFRKELIDTPFYPRCETTPDLLTSVQDRLNDTLKLLDNFPTAEVRPVKEGENITENNPVDEFVCSECGIIIEDWSRVEIDEDDGERTNHEYVFQFCPNCGVKLKGELVNL